MPSNVAPGPVQLGALFAVDAPSESGIERASAMRCLLLHVSPVCAVRPALSPVFQSSAATFPFRLP
eukprot:4876425-Prymnesium_polylepis.6